MKMVASPLDRNAHVKMARENSLVFNENAVEITIIDRWGRTLWKGYRRATEERLSWNGIDSMGAMVSSGCYTCKIGYNDGLVVYVPFVFLQE